MEDHCTLNSNYPISEDEAKKLMSGEYGRQLHKSVSSYVAPIFWTEKLEESDCVIANGTIFFWDTGERLIAVTANHVFEAYCQYKQDRHINCQIQNFSFDPEERLIAQNNEYDIATFSISRQEVQEIDVNILHGWPPTPPAVGRGILFAGCPGHERERLGPNTGSFGVFPAIAVASSVSNRQITCHIEPEYLVDSWGAGIPASDYDLRGMSGGPVLTVIESKQIVSFRLGGVIKESNQKLGLLIASKAEVIQPDGKIIAPQLP